MKKKYTIALRKGLDKLNISENSDNIIKTKSKFNFGKLPCIIGTKIFYDEDYLGIIDNYDKLTVVSNYKKEKI